MDKRIEIDIEELGPVRHSKIELKPFMVFSGESSTGKSYTALLVHFIYRLICGSELADFFREKRISYDALVKALPDEREGVLYSFTSQDLEDWCNRAAIRYVGEMLGFPDFSGKISIRFIGIDSDFRFAFKRDVIEMNGEMDYSDLVSLNEAYRLRLPHFSSTWSIYPFRKLLSLYLKTVYQIEQRDTFILPPSRGNLLLLTDESRSSFLSSGGMYSEFILDFSFLKSEPLEETGGGQYIGECVDLIRGIIIQKDNDLYYKQGNQSQAIPITATASSIKELTPFVMMVQKGLVSKYSVMFEEPEAHLHPELQIKVADFLADLLASGCRFQITTHSDYFLRRINDLIRLHWLKENMEAEEYSVFCTQHHFNPDRTISDQKVGAYYFKRLPDDAVEIMPQSVEKGIPFDTFRSVLDNQMTDSSYVYDKMNELYESPDC